jgi:hypothetical protein
MRKFTGLTPTPGYFTVPPVAVNAKNPQPVVAVFQDNAHAAYCDMQMNNPFGRNRHPHAAAALYNRQRSLLTAKGKAVANYHGASTS